MTARACISESDGGSCAGAAHRWHDDDPLVAPRGSGRVIEATPQQKMRKLLMFVTVCVPGARALTDTGARSLLECSEERGVGRVLALTRRHPDLLWVSKSGSAGPRSPSMRERVQGLAMFVGG